MKLRPEPYRVPDRAAWRGPLQPYVLDGYADEAAQVMALIQGDLGTIDFTESNEFQDEIHLVCESVAAMASAPDSALCFFDQEDSRFWIFPTETTPIELLDARP